MGILFVFGLLFTQAFTDAALAKNAGAESARPYYGSIGTSAYTLFKAVTGGVSWGDAASPLSSLHPVWEAVFVLYVAFTYFAVLNVVTGVFCQSAMDSAAFDKDMVVQAELNNREMYSQQLVDLFRK